MQSLHATSPYARQIVERFPDAEEDACSAAGFSTPLPSISMPVATTCSAGSVLRFSIAAVTLELESADVPDAGENVSSFSVPTVPTPFATSLEVGGAEAETCEYFTLEPFSPLKGLT